MLIQYTSSYCRDKNKSFLDLMYNQVARAVLNFNRAFIDYKFGLGWTVFLMPIQTGFTYIYEYSRLDFLIHVRIFAYRKHIVFMIRKSFLIFFLVTVNILTYFKCM